MFWLFACVGWLLLDILPFLQKLANFNPRMVDLPVYNESDFKHEFGEVTEYDVKFPTHRINYMKDIQSFLNKALDNKKLSFEINWTTSTMYVKTDSRTRDPYIIIKAYEMIQCIAKGMSLEDAVSLLEDGVFCEIIYMNVLVKNSDAYENRRNRLMNPKVLKALGILTKTKIMVGSKAVCVVGDHDGIDAVRDVVLKCFKNIHPAYEIKNLMIKNNLVKDGVEGDWERFLPKIQKGKQIKPKRADKKNPEE